MAIWPYWPVKFTTSSSQAEGAAREFSAATLGMVGENGHVTGVKCCRVDEKRHPIEGTEFILPADLVLLAIGFAKPKADGVIAEINPELDKRGNIKADELSYKIASDKVYVAGDARRGASLVVWAIREGRQAAHAIDKDLMGSTKLPR